MYLFFNHQCFCLHISFQSPLSRLIPHKIGGLVHDPKFPVYVFYTLEAISQYMVHVRDQTIAFNGFTYAGCMVEASIDILVVFSFS